MVPGHPEHGPFHLVRGLLNAADRFPWDPIQGNKGRLLCWLLPILAAQRQEKLPYAPHGVDCNDVLYAGDPSFEEEWEELLDEIIGSIRNTIQDMQQVISTASRELAGSFAPAQRAMDAVVAEAAVALGVHLAPRSEEAQSFLQTLLRHKPQDAGAARVMEVVRERQQRR